MGSSTATENSVMNRVIRVLSTQVNNSDKVSVDADLVEDLGLDSLDVVEVVLALEEEFGVEVPDSDADKFKTVRNVVEYIEGKLGNAGAAEAISS